MEINEDVKDLFRASRLADHPQSRDYVGLKTAFCQIIPDSRLVFLLAEWVVQVSLRALSRRLFPARILGQYFGCTQFECSQALVAGALHALVFRQAGQFILGLALDDESF